MAKNYLQARIDWLTDLSFKTSETFNSRFTCIFRQAQKQPPCSCPSATPGNTSPVWIHLLNTCGKTYSYYSELKTGHTHLWSRYFYTLEISFRASSARWVHTLLLVERLEIVILLIWLFYFRHFQRPFISKWSKQIWFWFYNSDQLVAFS